MPALLVPNDILALSAQAAERLLEAGDGDCALLYLALLQSGGNGEKAQRALHWEDLRFQEASARLIDLKLMRPDQAIGPAEQQAEEPPAYTRADIADALEREPEFKNLADAVEECLGRHMNDMDLKTLYTIYDDFALPSEVIFMLANWCLRETQRKLGAGHRPRMPDIKKEALRWKRQGLTTHERAEEYLRRQEALTGRERDLLPLLDIRDRPAVPREREYLAAWADMGFADDAIRLAYERTIFQKQKLNWPYMNSILKRWHDAGLHTAAQVEERDRPAPNDSAASRQMPRARSSRPQEDYQPTVERIQQSSDWLDEFLKTQGGV